MNYNYVKCEDMIIFLKKDELNLEGEDVNKYIFHTNVHTSYLFYKCPCISCKEYERKMIMLRYTLDDSEESDKILISNEEEFLNRDHSVCNNNWEEFQKKNNYKRVIYEEGEWTIRNISKYKPHIPPEMYEEQNFDKIIVSKLIVG
jgi:hypothetical protein